MSALDSKRVMFIGCGCLGSKIATALAASGVGHFILIDHDVMEPYNSVRHELGVESFGFLKSHALANRLICSNPLLNSERRIKVYGWNAGGLLPSKNDDVQLRADFSESDLIIDTTGLHHVSRWLNEECFDLKIASLYASVTNGAWGGEILRVIPQLTPCWRCWAQEFHDQRLPAEPADEIGLFAPGCDQPTFTGTAYETGIVANFAAMMAVETLLRGTAGRTDFGGNYIRWACRDASGAPVLRSEILATTYQPQCYLSCGH